MGIATRRSWVSNELHFSDFEDSIKEV